MKTFKEMAIDYLVSQGIKFDDVNERVIRVSYNSDNAPQGIRVTVVFDENNANLVSFYSYSIANFNGKEATALSLCNSLNAKWRWVKFYIDKDGDITSEIDAQVDENTCGEETLNLIRRTVRIIDDSYADIMRAKFC